MRGLLAAALLAIATLYVASQIRFSTPWAMDLCDLAANTCNSPGLLSIALAGVVLVFTLVSLMRE